jgi:methionyl-tRNA formyltransferase
VTDQVKVLFMGTPDFAVPSFEALVREGYNVIGVVTQPDRPKGRKQELTPPPVKVAAQKLGLPVYQPEKLRDPEAVEKVLSLGPDLIVTAAYGQILPEAILNAPKFGCINVHASLLPKYRGGAPIHHAIINGEKETGVTIMYMVKALDAGDIITQRSIPITEADHVGTMHDKLSLLGAELLTEILPPLLQGKVKAVKQEESQVTYAPNITREDEKIDWSRSAVKLWNQVRGLHPWPVAFTTWRDKPFKIWWAEPIAEHSPAKPGTVVRVDETGIFVATGNGLLLLKEVQPAGKRRMPVAEFVRGRQMTVGEQLGDTK